MNVSERERKNVRERDKVRERFSSFERNTERERQKEAVLPEVGQSEWKRVRGLRCLERLCRWAECIGLSPGVRQRLS